MIGEKLTVYEVVEEVSSIGETRRLTSPETSSTMKYCRPSALAVLPLM